MIHALLLLAAAAPAAAPGMCPKINVAFAVTRATGPTFRVAARPPLKAAALTFNWSVSAGTIRKGQGTSKILITAPKGTTITATVEIAGLPSQCTAVSSATGAIPGRRRTTQ